jgi:anaerobic selenocysteine-containing dehydrogenase
MWAPGGFHRPVKARVREWKTPNKKANFVAPSDFFKGHEQLPDGMFDLITLRSNDQFNTTVYGFKDRYREVFDTRKVLLMHPSDMISLGISDGELVDVFGDDSDGVERCVPRLCAVAYNIATRCCAGYYPECNPLIPWWHHAKESKTPAAKLVRVRVQKP